MIEREGKQEKQLKYLKLFQKALDNDGRFGTVIAYCSNNNSDYDSILINVPPTLYREQQEDIFFSRLKVDNKSYISFREKYRNWFNENNVETYQTKSDEEQKFFRIQLSDFDNLIDCKIDELSKLIVTMFLNEINFTPFGCCSRYVECSNQRKCIHPDFLYSTACMYRKNLEQNKIFYGVNKNINVSKKYHNFVVCDVETADKGNGYICSIGLAIVTNNKVENTNYTLIKPDCEFCERNIKIHGITEDMVNNAPTFSEFWSENHTIFENSIIVFQGASFDLNVIKKELVRNNIHHDKIKYIDSMQIAKSCLDLERYKLPDICNALNIKLDNHHCALDDCVATANVLIKLLNEYDIKFDKFVKVFDVNAVRNTSNTSKRKTEINIGITLPTKPTKSIDFDFFDKCPPNIDFKNVTVCLSGNFESMSKSEFANMLEDRGAAVKNSITKSIEYLIVGGQGSSYWSQGSYGAKIEKAIEFKSKGSNILIIKEEDFLKSYTMSSEQTTRNIPKNASYIPPKDEWHRFESVEETILFLKQHNMLGKTATELKNIYYNGFYTNEYILCNVCGYVDDTIIVIEIGDKLHCIDIDCLKDMQPTKFEKEKYGLI